MGVAVLLATGATGCGGSAGADAPASTPAGAPATATVGPTASAAPAPPARVARPDSIRALYVNGWAMGSRPRMAELIRIADETEINAFVLDVKESDTYLVHSGSQVPLAREIGADQRPGTTWLPELLDTLRAHGIYSIARIVVFKDRMLAEKKPALAIQHVNGGLWRDRKGGAWVNPYDRRVWDYNIAIAKEVLAMGMNEVQWDYVRFPDVTDAMRATMAFPGSGAVSRQENIAAFITYSKAQLRSFNVPVTADVFGLVTHLGTDVQIGQHWETLITTADALLPMVYPSHYSAGLYGYARPQANPYEIIRLSMADAVERARFAADSLKRPAGEIRPWLEAMSIRGMSYGPRELRLQIQATHDAGLVSWALWNPGSKYGEYRAALRPAGGGLSPLERSGWRPPSGWVLPRERLSRVIAQRTRPATAPGGAPAGPPGGPAPGSGGG